MADEFYRPVAQDICQGDIFAGVPQLFLKPPLLALRKVSLAGDREAMGYYEYPPPTPKSPGGSEGKALPGGPFRFHTPAGEAASAACNVTTAIVLNHDCEIENEHDHRLVALVRPVPQDLNAEHATILRQNQNYSYFYLPAHEAMPEAYVDFRRMTSLAPALLVPTARLTSLTPEAVKALLWQLFRFFSHSDR